MRQSISYVCCLDVVASYSRDVHYGEAEGKVIYLLLGFGPCSLRALVKPQTESAAYWPNCRIIGRR